MTDRPFTRIGFYAVAIAVSVLVSSLSFGGCMAAAAALLFLLSCAFEVVWGAAPGWRGLLCFTAAAGILVFGVALVHACAHAAN